MEAYKILLDHVKWCVDHLMTELLAISRASLEPCAWEPVRHMFH